MVGKAYEVLSMPLHPGAHLLGAGIYRIPLQPKHPGGSLLLGKFCLQWDLGVRAVSAFFSGRKGRTGWKEEEGSVFSGKGGPA